MSSQSVLRGLVNNLAAKDKSRETRIGKLHAFSELASNPSFRSSPSMRTSVDRISAGHIQGLPSKFSLLSSMSLPSENSQEGTVDGENWDGTASEMNTEASLGVSEGGTTVASCGSRRSFYKSDELTGSSRRNIATYGELMERGFQAFLKLDYERAYMNYTAAMRQDTKQVSAYTFRGLVGVMKRQDLKKALNDLDRAVQYHRFSAFPHYVRGKCHMAMGQHDKAVLDLENAIRVHEANLPDEFPDYHIDFPEILHTFGLAKRAKKLYSEAMPLLERAVEMAPDRAEYLTTLGSNVFDTVFSTPAIREPVAPTLLNREIILLQDRARSLFEDSLRLEDDQSLPWYYLGRIHRHRKDLKGAHAAFTRALRRKNGKSNPDIYNERGAVYQDMFMFDEALKDHLKAIQLSKETQIRYQDLKDPQTLLEIKKERWEYAHRTQAEIHKAAENVELQKAVRKWDRAIAVNATSTLLRKLLWRKEEKSKLGVHMPSLGAKMLTYSSLPVERIDTGGSQGTGGNSVSDSLQSLRTTVRSKSTSTTTISWRDRDSQSIGTDVLQTSRTIADAESEFGKVPSSRPGSAKSSAATWSRPSSLAGSRPTSAAASRVSKLSATAPNPIAESAAAWSKPSSIAGSRPTSAAVSRVSKTSAPVSGPIMEEAVPVATATTATKVRFGRDVDANTPAQVPKSRLVMPRFKEATNLSRAKHGQQGEQKAEFSEERREGHDELDMVFETDIGAEIVADHEIDDDDDANGPLWAKYDYSSTTNSKVSRVCTVVSNHAVLK